MGFLVIIPFAGLAVWCIYGIARRMQSGDYSPKWRKAFRVLLVAGAALGVWLGFFTRYQVGNNRMEGFPIPAGITSRENATAPWMKSAMPDLVRWGALITDVLCGVAFALAPIGVAAFFRENRIRRDAEGRPLN